MEENLILEGLLSMVTELKEKQEQQVTPASREETINRLDVIEQRISDMQDKSGITENSYASGCDIGQHRVAYGTFGGNIAENRPDGQQREWAD